MTVFPANHVSIFCMGLCISSGSHVKCIYMIDREHNHVVLSDHASLSCPPYVLFCFISLES